MKGPHQGQPVRYAGADLEAADAVMILVHGRGAAAEDILTLAPSLNQPRFAFVAPQASDQSWYPYSFLAPLALNEPGLSSGLQTIADLLQLTQEAGFPPDRVMLLGFSQGGCLALEFAARRAQKYGGVIGLSAGLIGPDETPREYSGSLASTPVFLGCSDPDPHIPTARVEESADVFRSLGADVTKRLYPNLGHSINQDEIAFVANMMQELLTT